MNPLRGQNNVQGAAHMGCDPMVLPGSTPLEGGRARVRSACGSRRFPRHRPQPDADDGCCREGRFKALWAIGYDVAPDQSKRADTRRALALDRLVVVQDLFLTETARVFGTVFLPACSSFEKDGTFMNSERRIQRVRKAIEPVGQSRADWEIMCAVANAHGPTRRFRVPERRGNLERDALGLRRRPGMTYARLDAAGLQWPCPTEDHPGTARLHADRLSRRASAALRCIDWRPTSEQPTPRFPFLLVTGRSLYQFNAGTMTGRTRLNDLRPADYLDIAPEDAARLGLHDDDPVRVVSALRGSRVAGARQRDGVARAAVRDVSHDVRCS